MSAGSESRGSPGSDGARVGDENESREGDPPVSDARADGAEAVESGYRRDDYWREAARGESVTPTDVPEPPQGYAFEDADEKAEAPSGSHAGEDEGGAAAERSDGADGRDGA